LKSFGFDLRNFTTEAQRHRERIDVEASFTDARRIRRTAEAFGASKRASIKAAPTRAGSIREIRGKKGESPSPRKPAKRVKRIRQSPPQDVT
jgi:hypothetical protein